MYERVAAAALQSTLDGIHLLSCRQIELQQEQEAAELCELWNELRQKLLSVFQASSTQPTVTQSAIESSSMHSTTDDSIHELVERLDISQI